MNYDVTTVKGDRNKPAIIFIHGLGIDKEIWESPDEARVLGGRFPIRQLICRKPGIEEEAKGLFSGKPMENLTTLFQDFKERGYTVIAWSQKRPAAEIEVAVSELRDIIKASKVYCKSGIILIGHSRGGLVARRYLANNRDKRVRSMVTLSTPHKGSRMAQWAGYIAPLISAPVKLLRLFGNTADAKKKDLPSDPEKGALTSVVKRIFEFLTSKAVAELLPDSSFFKTLDDGPVGGVYYLSFGGKDPTFFCLYRTVSEDGGQKGSVIRVQRVFAIPEIFEHLIPERFFPEEMKKGRGDGLVSIESSRLPWADEHYNFDLNHAGILFDEGVRGKVMDAINKITE